jgi:hypothetical protein
VVNQKRGVSALGLQRVFGFGSYQTAWAWLHRLRRAMVIPRRELLAGAVEVDESYFGARRPDAGGRGVTGMRRIADVTKATLTDFVLDHIARGSEVRTDGWQGYFDVGRHPPQARGHQPVGLGRSRPPPALLRPGRLPRSRAP